MLWRVARGLAESQEGEGGIAGPLQLQRRVVLLEAMQQACAVAMTLPAAALCRRSGGSRGSSDTPPFVLQRPQRLVSVYAL